MGQHPLTALAEDVGEEEGGFAGGKGRNSNVR